MTQWVRALVWARDGGIGAGARVSDDGTEEVFPVAEGHSRFAVAVGMIANALFAEACGSPVRVITDSEEAAAWFTAAFAGAVVGHDELSDRVTAYALSAIEAHPKSKVIYPDRYCLHMVRAHELATAKIKEGLNA